MLDAIALSETCNPGFWDFDDNDIPVYVWKECGGEKIGLKIETPIGVILVVICRKCDFI